MNKSSTTSVAPHANWPANRPPCAGRLRCAGVLAVAATTAIAAIAGLPTAGASTAGATEPPWALQTQALLTQAAQGANGARSGPARIEVTLGSIDPRLTLAPCRRIEPYLPAGMKVLGRTRVGLRCVEGSTSWNITLPVTVSLFAPGVVLRQALPAGTLVGDEQLTTAEVNWATEAGRAFSDSSAIVGRELTRPLAAGQAVLSTDLKQRQWFAAGDTVQLKARGAGFVITTDGQALNPGLEGQSVRVRTGNGRVVNGRATGERQVEVQL